MSTQQFLNYLGAAAQILNKQLGPAIQFVQSWLLVEKDSIPNLTDTPLSFAAVFMFAVYFLLSYANSFICDLVGILYPLAYGYYLCTGQMTTPSTVQPTQTHPLDNNSMDNSTDNSNTMEVTPSTSTPSTDKLLTLNKYWIIFGLLMLVDAFLGFILHLIPGYFYLKLGFIYAIVRSEFAYTSVVFDILVGLCNQYSLRPLIAQALTSVTGQFYSATGRTKKSE
jgi:hypothetical protein